MLNTLATLLAAAALAIGIATAAPAQQQDIEGTISRQFDAFRADDFATAFTFATPDLQRLFQSPQNFERMVTQGYPMVWRFRDVQFLDLREEAGAMIQVVEVIDDRGARHLLAYRMEQTEAGWRIGGVQILKQPGVAA